MSSFWGILAKKLGSNNDVVSFSGDYINMEFDLITSESHRWTADVTSNPVEKGEPVCDHVQRKPDTLDISGIISNASIERWRGLIIERVAGLLSQETETQKAFDQLYQLMESRQPVTVYTRYQHYADMVLTSLSVPRKKEDGDSIEFTASFTHVKIVSTLLVDAKDVGINPEKSDSASTQRKSSPKKNKGSVKGSYINA